MQCSVNLFLPTVLEPLNRLFSLFWFYFRKCGFNFNQIPYLTIRVLVS